MIKFTVTLYNSNFALLVTDNYAHEYDTFAEINDLDDDCSLVSRVASLLDNETDSWGDNQPIYSESRHTEYFSHSYNRREVLEKIEGLMNRGNNKKQRKIEKEKLEDSCCFHESSFFKNLVKKLTTKKTYLKKQLENKMNNIKKDNQINISLTIRDANKMSEIVSAINDLISADPSIGNMSGADHSSIGNMSGADHSSIGNMSGADLKGANMRGALIKNTKFPEDYLTGGKE